MSIHIHHDDDHTVAVLDEVSMSFMALLTERINRQLRENGIDDPAQREKICGDVMFDLSYQLDAGWFEVEDTRYFPKLCFLERAQPAAGALLGDVEQLHLPTEASSLHEYAFGVVSDYFDADESLDPPVKAGSYQSDNAES
jgi:hypothetical protein